MKKIFSIFIVTFISVSMYSQQDSQFTQYMYNTVNINPAYAGARNVLSVFGLHRNQWVGLDGAPETNAFSINTPIRYSNLGVGISFLNDKIGPSDENTISADVSYSIKTSEDYKLAFGVKASANLLNIDFNKISKYNPTDALASQNIENQLSPNVGAGLFLSSNKTYFGLSIPSLLETKHFDHTAVASVATEKMHVYFIAGRVFDVMSDLKFKPTILTKIVQGAPLQADLSANFIYSEKFTLGVSYRWDASFSGMAGFQISNSWFLGYAYDMDTSQLARHNSGSHEFFLRYEFFKDLGKSISPRFF